MWRHLTGDLEMDRRRLIGAGHLNIGTTRGMAVKSQHGNWEFTMDINDQFTTPITIGSIVYLQSTVLYIIAIVVTEPVGTTA